LRRDFVELSVKLLGRAAMREEDAENGDAGAEEGFKNEYPLQIAPIASATPSDLARALIQPEAPLQPSQQSDKRQSERRRNGRRRRGSSRSRSGRFVQIDRHWAFVPAPEEPRCAANNSIGRSCLILVDESKRRAASRSRARS
jgi:hypothetical protein